MIACVRSGMASSRASTSGVHMLNSFFATGGYSISIV